MFFIYQGKTWYCNVGSLKIFYSHFVPYCESVKRSTYLSLEGFISLNVFLHMINKIKERTNKGNYSVSTNLFKISKIKKK